VTARRRALGTLGEEVAARHLRRRGFTLLERNARTRHGELDIVALDGRALVFVEVKAGRAGASAGPERPALAVGPRKQRRLRGLARAWLCERRGVRYEAIRYDVIGVTVARDGTVAELEHIEAAI
jgi:putative endonuclease